MTHGGAFSPWLQRGRGWLPLSHRT